MMSHSSCPCTLENPRNWLLEKNKFLRCATKCLQEKYKHIPLNSIPESHNPPSESGDSFGRTNPRLALCSSGGAAVLHTGSGCHWVARVGLMHHLFHTYKGMLMRTEDIWRPRSLPLAPRPHYISQPYWHHLCKVVKG